MQQIIPTPSEMLCLILLQLPCLKFSFPKNALINKNDLHIFPKSLYPRSIQLSLLNDWSGQRSFHGPIECKATQNRQVDLLSLQKSQSYVNGSQCEVFWACYQRCCKLVRSIAVFFRLSSMLSFPFMFHIFLRISLSAKIWNYHV